MREAQSHLYLQQLLVLVSLVSGFMMPLFIVNGVERETSNHSFNDSVLLKFGLIVAAQSYTSE